MSVTVHCYCYKGVDIWRIISHISKIIPLVFSERPARNVMFLEREPGQAGRADDRLAEEGVFENDYHPGNICPPCLTNCLPITKIFLHESNDLAIFFTNSGRKWSFLVNF